MKIIAVSPHPDDLEISCSATLRKFQQQGADILSIVTVKPSVEDNPDRTHAIVSSELEQSYKISGFDLRVYDTNLHANGRPNLVCDNNTMAGLSRLLEPCDLAIIPHANDYHQDHRTTHQLAWPLLRRLAKEIWAVHSWPYCYHIDSPNLYVDIDKQWNFKASLLDCYSSYIDANKTQQILATNQYWGHANGSRLCEAYTLMARYDR
jgi:LmbE family N-acetylglucosaminyl deacetylase